MRKNSGFSKTKSRSAFRGGSEPIRRGESPRPTQPSRRTDAPRGQEQGRAVGSDKAARPRQFEVPKDLRIVMGTHAILEAAAVHIKHCRELWIKEGWESSQDLKKIVGEVKPFNVKIRPMAESVIDRFGSHQGAILLVAKAPEVNWPQLEKAEQSTLVLLDGIEDPHNLGAILRTSWLMGVHAVMTPQDRAVGLTPTVHKVACGGAEHVPVEPTANFAGKIAELKEQGYWVFGLSHKGKSTLFDQQIPEKVIWCIGAEDKGLRSTTERFCDELVSIPQVSANASYNASVATAIALTETARQRSAKASEKS